jgi:hypothetical protein
MTEPLVAVTAPHPRTDALSLAARLSHVGIGAMLLPEPARPGRFRLSVPRPVAGAAARHLERWARPDAPAGEGAYRTPAAADEEEALPTRRRRLAACFALGFGFGLGHVYAREYLAGLILALGQLACLLLAARGIPEVLWAFPVLMGLDAWGSVAAVRRENEGQRREPAAQLAATLPAVAFVVASAAVAMPSGSGSSSGAEAQTAPPPRAMPLDRPLAAWDAR